MKEIPFRNRNQTGWWIASYLERFEWDNENKANKNRRCLAWENTIVVQAEDREEAYEKAVRVARFSHGLEARSVDGKRKGQWRVEGLTLLLPIYEQFEDGAEILWREYDGKTVKSIQAMVKRKRELEAFDDSEPQTPPPN
jgi:hypothetical protein